jgi:inorganic triphosphatase YgiF
MTVGGPIVEREYRFTHAGRLPPTALAGPTWRGFAVTRLPTERQRNTYFDTPTGALARQGITLRQRRLADRCEVTLKLAKRAAAAHLCARPEVTDVVAPGTPLAGQRLLALAGRLAPGEAIGPWFTACTLRQAVALQRGTTVIHLTWDTVTLPDDPVYVDHTIEIELVAGPLADLTALARLLVGAFGLAFAKHGKRHQAAAHLRRRGLLPVAGAPAVVVAAA